MKLSAYAKLNGISYQTAWRHYKQGLIKTAFKLESGTIIVPDAQIKVNASKTLVYTRVSSSENKSNLDSQADRVVAFCLAKGWVVDEVIKEVGSGLNDTRPKLLKALSSGGYSRIVVEHKDRLTRFGFNYIDTLLTRIGCEVVVINLADNSRDDLMQDFVSIITSFCARLYGHRRSKRKTEKLIEELNATPD